MSDIERLIATFNEIGIKFKLKEYENTETAEYDGELMYNKKIKIDNGVGYYRFNCCFYFLDGKCTGHGVWE